MYPTWQYLRVKFQKPEEIKDLISLYNQFPISEVIIHARVREDYYKNPVNYEAFAEGFSQSIHPVCYNGDIFCAQDVQEVTKRFPKLSAVMVGRGMIANPQLTESFDCAGDKSLEFSKEDIDYARWKAFLDELCYGYEYIMSGGRNVLFKLKEVWSYMIPLFPECEKYGKKIKKAKKLLKLTVDDGRNGRQIVSGIANWYQPEDLIGRKIVFVANLAPAKLCGELSEGMILACDAGDNDVRVLFLDKDVPNGSTIR